MRLALGLAAIGVLILLNAVAIAAAFFHRAAARADTHPEGGNA